MNRYELRNRRVVALPVAKGGAGCEAGKGLSLRAEMPPGCCRHAMAGFDRAAARRRGPGCGKLPNG